MEPINRLVRFEPDTYEELRRLAEVEHRSIQGQIMVAVEFYLAEKEKAAA